MDYEKILEYVKRKHEGQIRRSGEPVINHPIGVAELLAQKGFDTRCQIVGLLHDVLEDTDATVEELLALTGDQEIVDAVVSLTKTDDMTLEESINNAKANKYGKDVKGADRLQNAKTTYGDRNSQEFISGFIYKSMVFYVPALEETQNVYLEDLLVELKRLYGKMVPVAKEWVDERLAENDIKNIFQCQ